MNIEVESEQVTPSLFQGQAQIHQSSGTFQLQRKYIITSTKSEMLIIDQHRAHFRILYEELLKKYYCPTRFKPTAFVSFETAAGC